MGDVVIRSSSALKPLMPLLAGLALTLAQMVVGGCFVARAGPQSNRYFTLI